MVLFPIAVIWLVVVIVWVVRNSQNAGPEDPVWRRWRSKPRRPRDGDSSGRRDRAGRRASATER
jgi:hypothetical protein